ncbi:reverse transcriptase domain-containing protein [Tanacetum coccineum]
MKQLIAELPMLTAPMEKEELIVYLAATKEAVSAVLMTEREAKQMPIYFVSRALRGPKLNYTSMEKLVLALVHASKRLKRYFQAHPIIVITDQPIQQILSRPKVAGRLQKWSIELGEYAIYYRPRVSVKGKILADFIVERPEEDSPDTPMEFDATNNETEYEALIAGLRIAEQIGVKNLQANVDSRLVANQVNETYVAKEVDMIRYLEKLQQKQVLVEELKEKSISEVEILAVVEEEGDMWMTPIFKYLAEGTLPAEVKKAKAIRRKSWQFAANYVLREIHEGSCSMHAGIRSFMAKALWTGYYWPTMHIDARTLIRACQDWQVHKPVARNPQQKLTPITSLWPFYRWGIDITGPFPEGLGKFRLPGEIISDNGKNFRDDPFKDWCENKCIHQQFASVKHPQTNRLVERANHSLGEGIKARLEARSKNWMEELPHVLWAHRTMIKSSNGDTSFSLTYGTEAVILAEIGMPTLRTAEVDLVQNNEALKIILDILEEKREEAAIRDLVYRNNDASRSEDTGKLGPKWEGPYEITKALGKEAYKLRYRDGKQLPRTWNISNLKKCYVHTM